VYFTKVSSSSSFIMAQLLQLLKEAADKEQSAQQARLLEFMTSLAKGAASPSKGPDLVHALHSKHGVTTESDFGELQLPALDAAMTSVGMDIVGCVDS